MARVPLVEGPQLRTEALPGVRQQIATPADAFGGVQICPKQDMRDPRARLDIKKGCQEVDGETADYTAGPWANPVAGVVINLKRSEG